MLARYGFGRAHHRALHSCSRHPGITVAELLDILKITKQSLGRVLRELVETGFVVQREGQNDRRQRLLYLTDKGARLAAEVATVQTSRLARALADSGETRAGARRFFAGILDPDVRRRRRTADRARRQESPRAAQIGGAVAAPIHRGSGRCAASPGRRRRRAHRRAAVALSRRERLSRHHRVVGGGSARPAREPVVRPARARRDDAGRNRLCAGALGARAAPKCRS